MLRYYSYHDKEQLHIPSFVYLKPLCYSHSHENGKKGNLKKNNGFPFSRE